MHEPKNMAAKTNDISKIRFINSSYIIYDIGAIEYCQYLPVAVPGHLKTDDSPHDFPGIAVTGGREQTHRLIILPDRDVDNFNTA